MKFDTVLCEMSLEGFGRIWRRIGTVCTEVQKVVLKNSKNIQ